MIGSAAEIFAAIFLNKFQPQMDTLIKVALDLGEDASTKCNTYVAHLSSGIDSSVPPLCGSMIFVLGPNKGTENHYGG